MCSYYEKYFIIGSLERIVRVLLRVLLLGSLVLLCTRPVHIVVRGSFHFDLQLHNTVNECQIFNCMMTKICFVLILYMYIVHDVTL